MKYAETIERLEEQFKQENERKMAISEQMEEHRNKGFFYRVTHWREYRGLRRSFNEVDKLGDALSLDLDHYRELKYENQVNTANDFGNQVFEEIKQYAAEQGLYLAKDVELSVSSEDAVEENPKMTDYNWIIKHGDTHTDVLTVSSVEELREKIESYGDMIPFSPEEQEQIVREIESKVGLFEDERVSLQNSDQGVQVVISDNDQFGNGSNLLDKKISYEELSERIQIDGKENTDPYKKISLNLDLELEVQTRKNIDAAEQHFAEKGLYPSNRIGVMPPGPMGSGITLFVEADAYVAEDDSFTKIPTKDQIVGFVEENHLLTRISPEEQKALLEELNKITYESDENVHSYSTFVGDLEEHEGVPYFRVFDDTDKVFDYLTYDAETDNWVGDKNDFKIKNPVPSIKEKYQDSPLEKAQSVHEKQLHEEQQDDPTTEFSKVLSNMTMQELELMNLIDSEKNESIDNHFADFGNSQYEAEKALNKYVTQLGNDELYTKVKTLYENHVHGYIDTPPKEKVDLKAAGSMISESLNEKKEQFFGTSKNQTVLEGDPELLGYRWGLTYDKGNHVSKPTLQDFAREIDYYQMGKHPEGKPMEVNFHLWTFTEQVDEFGQSKKISPEGVVNIVNEVMLNEQSQEQVEGLPEGWRWRTYSDGSGSMLTPEGDHYFSFKQDNDGVVYSNPTTGEKEFMADIDDFKGNSKKWIEESLIRPSKSEESNYVPLDTEAELEI
ncbi:hypothetical protein [Enterococcus hulanensis]|uniref:hypothetical protein n=1 Tax=Enterococcus hulanensis TaxID=2559929 RepID=UPI0010F49971|nr:hypothetical protein [Enterococcus hulanensis]